LGTLIILKPMENDNDLIKNPYGTLTLKKLKAVIEEIFSDGIIARKQDQTDRMYQNMTPEGRQLFNDALKAQFDKQTEQELGLFRNRDIKIIKDKTVIPQLDNKIMSTGKTRKNNNHLIPKKKKRK
jgi:DNA-binding MarR family transcriptional regulator